MRELWNIAAAGPARLAVCLRVNVQTEVRAFLARHGLDHAPQVHALDLTSEVGEVAKALLEASDYGRTGLRPGEALVAELGDAFFSLVALAESLDVDLTAALSAALTSMRPAWRAKGASDREARKTPEPVNNSVQLGEMKQEWKTDALS